MKTNFKKYVLLAFVALACTHAFAGDKTGNGGDVLMLNGKPHLLDLVEAGLENSAVCGTVPKTKFEDILEQALLNHVNLSQELIECYLSKIAKYSEFEQTMMAAGLGLYQIRFVSTELQDVQDEFSSLQYDPKSIKQVAVRRDQSILVNRSLFSQLSLAEQAGLFLHEVIYAYLVPVKNASGTFHQESWQARQIVGGIFDQRLIPLSAFTYGGKAVLSFMNFEEEDALNLHSVGSVFMDSPHSTWNLMVGMAILVKDNIQPVHSSLPDPWLTFSINTPYLSDSEINLWVKDYCQNKLKEAQEKKKDLEFLVTGTWTDYQIGFADFPEMKILLPKASKVPDVGMSETVPASAGPASSSSGTVHSFEAKKFAVKTESDCNSFPTLVQKQMQDLRYFDLMH